MLLFYENEEFTYSFSNKYYNKVERRIDRKKTEREPIKKKEGKSKTTTFSCNLSFSYHTLLTHKDLIVHVR